MLEASTSAEALRDPAAWAPMRVDYARLAMRNGDWRACIAYLINEKMNAKVWDLMARSSEVTSMLVEKVKEETLRSYLFKYSSVYESISIGNL